MDRPNVILIVLDTARADVFEPWGGSPGTTPVMADLASSGHAPRLAVAPSCWTVPSHVSMFAGRDARYLALGQSPSGNPAGVRPSLRDHALELLPTVARQAGYDTRGASANAWLGATSGFDTGFGEFASLKHQRRAIHTDTGLLGRARWVASCARPDGDDGATHGRALLEEWMGAARADRPFFWFMNLVECHSPYMPPAPFNSLGLVDRLRAAADVARYQTFDGFLRLNVTDDPVSERSVRHMWQLYADSIRLLDHWLDWLVSELDGRGLADDTILMVTSDHGEHFGERDLWGHGHALDPELLHVPFVARGPGTAEWPDLLSLSWLPSLIAEATGLAAAEAWTRPGDIAVSSYDRLAPPDHPNLADLARRWPLTEKGRHLVTTSLTSATDGSQSVLVSGGETGDPDLLDISYEGDPDPATRRRLLTAVEPLLDQLARNPQIDVSPASPTVDEEDLREQMRLLGYME